MQRILVSILFIFSIAGHLTAQPEVYSDRITNDKIRTVQLFNPSWNLSYPILKLNDTEKLQLQFDLLGDQAESYYYTFVHCDKDWHKSDLFFNDYMEGYEENPVEDYQPSFNTTVRYYHYSLSFPNERVTLKLSGNYALLVYPPGKKDDPEIIMRFMVSEDKASVTADIHMPQMTSARNSSQQVEFSVTFPGIKVIDPARNIFANVLQNGRWDRARLNIPPDIAGESELKYGPLSNKNIFPAGNEFRYFDIKSIKYKSEFVKEIDFAPPYYNVFLFPSENRELKPYFYWKDFNGKYYVAFQEGRDPATEADYIMVYFTLPSDRIAGGDVFVAGAFNNWVLDKSNLMTYNADKKQYEASLLLKQGWYNYEYVFKSNRTMAANGDLFEGNHYETENDYLIIIYYRNPAERYDRILSATVFNTMNKPGN